MSQSLAELQQYLSKISPWLSRIKPWAAVAVALALVLASYYGIQGLRYWQASQEEESQAAKIRQLSLILAGRQPEAAIAETDLQDQRLLLEDLVSLYDYPLVDDLIGILSRTAQEAGVHLASVGASDLRPVTEDGIRYSTIPMSITIQGEAPNVYRFLSLLQQRVPVTQTTSVRLAGLDSEPSAQVQLVFYLSPDVRLEEEAG